MPGVVPVPRPLCLHASPILHPPPPDQGEKEEAPLAGAGERSLGGEAESGGAQSLQPAWLSLSGAQPDSCRQPHCDRQRLWLGPGQEDASHPRSRFWKGRASPP